MEVSIPEYFPKQEFSRGDVEIVAEQRKSLPGVIRVEVTEDAENWIIVTTFQQRGKEPAKERAARGIAKVNRISHSKRRNAPNSGDWFSVARTNPIRSPGGRGQTGWRPSPPDMRDFSWGVDALKDRKDERAQVLAGALRRLKKSGKKRLRESLPASIDISHWCSEIESQGDIGSCTAHAVVGMIEYFMRRNGDPTFQGSRLFVYKTTRRLANLVGDTGAQIRTALGAAVMCGTPPETKWPYTDDDPDWDLEPDSFVYSLAQNFQALSYFRYDSDTTSHTDRQGLLDDLKEALALEIPIAFGFYGFPSFDYPVNPGDMPFPDNTEKAEWGHAVMAVGYDDKKKVQQPWSGEVTTGALRVRNSWGKHWGEDGYGWLPYDYILHRLADDFWSIVDMEWLETQQFEE